MSLSKAEARKQLLKQRSAVSKAHGAASSASVCQHILTSEAYKNAQCILGYLAFGPELSIDAVLKQALLDGKCICVPQIISSTEFEAAKLKDMENFVLDRYGIRSVPKPIVFVASEKIDLVLVPAVAFAKNGGRMGMGAGYYDRFLLRCKQAELLGVAYEELLQEELPLEEHDIAIPKIVTESGVVKTTC